MSSGAQALESCSIAFSDHKQNARVEVEQPVHKCVPIWDIGTAGRGLACDNTMQSLHVVSLPYINIISLNLSY